MANQDRRDYGGYGEGAYGGSRHGGFGQGEYGGYGRGRPGGEGRMGREFEGTGTSDPVYDLVSVLYHALQGAETYHEYEQDARENGDRELAEFFHHVHREETRRADHAKRLLSDRLRRS